MNLDHWQRDKLLTQNIEIGMKEHNDGEINNTHIILGGIQIAWRRGTTPAVGM